MSNCTASSHMQYALTLAKSGRLRVSPNPMVGCVIVKDEQIIGAGYHQYFGGPHAEVYALQQAGQAAAGASAYVTLEPCAHTGKTPPCTEALIQAGIKKVYVACLDPNPLVAGKGVASLRAANIEVAVGLEKSAAEQLNAVFFHYITHKTPFVIAKWAMSLDGKTRTHPDDARDISSPAARLSTHYLRQAVDAILVGANTVRHDNPFLTVRLPDVDPATLKHPLRIIVSSRGNLPLDLNVFANDIPGKTIVATTTMATIAWRAKLHALNIEILELPANEDGRVNLRSLLQALGQRGIASLLVEGGMTLHESFFQENLVNQIQVYVAPVIIGSLPKKYRVPKIIMQQIDTDYLFCNAVTATASLSNDEGKTYV